MAEYEAGLEGRLRDLHSRVHHAAIGHTMLDELHGPLVTHIVEEATNVRVEHPVHSLSLDANNQRVQRLMRTATVLRLIRKWL